MKRFIKAVCVGIGATAAISAMALTANASDGGSDLPRAIGVVQARPTGGNVGVWTIGADNYLAGTVTAFPDGEVANGACARVTYRVASGANLAAEIRRSNDCVVGGGEGESQNPASTDVESYGVVNSFPADLIGSWDISGTVYTATASTQFEQSDRPFANGVCVQVKHPVSSTLALRIKTDDDCGSGPSMSPRYRVARGTLITIPEGLIGAWVVNTTTYQVLSETTLLTSHGAFVPGICVGVAYEVISDTNVARVVMSQSSDDCEGRDGKPRPPVTATIESRGVISSRPADGMFGLWVIGGKSFDAISGTTRFNQEHGQLDVGACAAVRATKVLSGFVAISIESKGTDDCAPREKGREDHHEAYGKITSLPLTGTLGTWTVGERDFEVTTRTVLSGGPFAVNQFVQVNFLRQTDGTYLALKIERKVRVTDDEIRLAKSFGRIVTRPVSPTVTGAWIIGNFTYTVSSTVQINPSKPFTVTPRIDASAVVSDCAEVVYLKQSAGGDRIALRIKKVADAKCTIEPTEKVRRVFGFVTQVPANGFVGTWIIGGHTIEAQASTVFSESRGVLAVGAFVEVKFTVEGGVLIAKSITTIKPPESGERGELGKFENAAGLVNGPQAVDADQPFYVNGRVYYIVDATIIDESKGLVASGQPVIVNAYQDSTGRFVATKITAVSAVHTVFLPASLAN